MSDFGLKSLTWRMVFWILGTVGIVYIATTFYSNLLSRRMMLETAQREAESVTRAEIGEIQKVLRSVEENTQFLAAVIELLDPTEEEPRATLQAFVQGDERIYGSASAFVPSPAHRALGWRGPDGRPRGRRLPLLGEGLVCRTGRFGSSPVVGALCRRRRW